MADTIYILVDESTQEVTVDDSPIEVTMPCIVAFNFQGSIEAFFANLPAYTSNQEAIDDGLSVGSPYWAAQGNFENNEGSLVRVI